MAGGSSPSDIVTTSLSPKVKGTEKKKRKRPSKKVPTTVLEASSTNFMDLVQKLTGSAAEFAAAKDSEKRLAKPVINHPNSSGTPSPFSSPYSSPSADYIDPRPSASSEPSYYQQLLRSATMASYGDGDDDSSSHSNYTPAPYPSPNAQYLPHEVVPASVDHFHHSANSGYYNTGVADDDDFYNSYPSSSARAIENEISPFSSSWRDQMTGHSDYWYQQMDAMRA